MKKIEKKATLPEEVVCYYPVGRFNNLEVLALSESFIIPNMKYTLGHAEYKRKDTTASELVKRLPPGYVRLFLNPTENKWFVDHESKYVPSGSGSTMEEAVINVLNKLSKKTAHEKEVGIGEY